MNMLSSTDGKVEEKIVKKSQDKAIIIESDMEDDMLTAALDIIEKNSYYIKTISNQELAQKLKEEFENKYYPTWICIVGKSFGSKVNAQKGHYLCFRIENKTIILPATNMRKLRIRETNGITNPMKKLIFC